MNMITFINCPQKDYIKNKKKLKDFEVCLINGDLSKKIKYDIKLDITHKLYEDYIRIIYLYENPCVLFDGNFEIVNNINCINNNIEFFLCYGTTNTINTRVMGNKKQNNILLKDIILEIEKSCDNDHTLDEVISTVLKVNTTDKINTLLKSSDYIIYPYEYFFSIDYEKIGKTFNENVIAIDRSKEINSINNKFKVFFLKVLGAPAYKYLTTLINSKRNKIGLDKFNQSQITGKIMFKEEVINTSISAIKILKEEKYKNCEYIILHNPKWLGVTSSTKELFDNLVPLQELYDKKIIEELSDVIIRNNIKQVIFSSFVDGWKNLAISLKEKNKNIKLKVFWHGSNSQISEKITINWRTNRQVIELHKEGIIDVFATCKESILNFYLSQGYKTHFIKNTVRLNNYAKKDSTNNNIIKIGLYAAGIDWRKNMFNQIAALSLIDNIEVESIPLNHDGKVFASRNNLLINGNASTIKREELLKKMSEKDINLYVTFSECAPMLPIESLELGVPCITGNNHHYFNNNKLSDFLVVEREDDVLSILEKIKYALENTEEILKLYQIWKKDYDKGSKKSVEEFINM